MRTLHHLRPLPRTIPLLLILAVGSSACSSGSDPAAYLEISKLAAKRSANGRIAVRLEVANSGGPRNTAFCVRVACFSAGAPSRLLEAREQCTYARLGSGEVAAFDFSMSERRSVGDVMVASMNTAGAGLQYTTTEVPK